MDANKVRAIQNAHAKLQDERDRHYKTKYQNAELAQQLKIANAERDALKEQLGAIETAKQGLETQNAELMEQLKNMNAAVQELMEEKDSYKRIREQHAMELKNKNRTIQTLVAQLTDSKEESTRMDAELQEYQTKEFNDDKNRQIHHLFIRLCLQGQDCDDKIKMLKEQHAKQIEGKDLEHAKVLNDKDLIIQDLAVSRSTAEQQTVDEVIKLTNEKDRLSLLVKNQREEIVLAERRLEAVRMMLKASYLQKKREVEVVELTQLQTELGKLYVELQEAKKPQEALMARLAAKTKGIEYLTKQHEEKLAAKDSEIQNLTKKVQDLQDSKLTSSKGNNHSPEAIALYGAYLRKLCGKST